MFITNFTYISSYFWNLRRHGPHCDVLAVETGFTPNTRMFVLPIIGWNERHETHTIDNDKSAFDYDWRL